MIEAVVRSIARLALKRQRLMWAVLAAMTLLASGLLSRFSIEPDVSQLLPDDNQVIRLSRLIDREVNSERQLMILLEGEQIEAQLPRLAAALRASPLIEKLDATREDFLGDHAKRIRAAPLYHLPESSLKALTQRMTDPGARQAALKEARHRLADDPLAGRDVVLADPLGLRWLLKSTLHESLPFKLDPGSEYLVLENRRKALLRITGQKAPVDFDYTAALIQDLRHRLGDTPHELIGTYATTYADAQRINADLKRSTLLSAFLVGLFLLFAMRRWTLALLVFAPIALSIYWTLPIAGALLGPLTLLTIGAAAILIGLGVDFTIHYLVSYVEERQAKPHALALDHTAKSIGPPLVASMLTTIAAFSSLAFAHFSGLRVFGLLLTMGLLLALASTLVVLPLLLKRYRPPAKPSADAAGSLIFDRLIQSRMGKPLAGLLLLLTIAGGAMAAQGGIEFSGDLRYLRPSDDATAVSERAFEKEFRFSMSPAVLLVPNATSLGDLKAGLEKLRQEGRIAWSTGAHITQLGPQSQAAADQFRRDIQGWIAATMSDLESLDFHAAPFKPGLEKLERQLLQTPPPLPKETTVKLDGNSYRLVLAYPRRSLMTQADWQSFVHSAEQALGRQIRAYHTLSVLEEIHAVILNDMQRMVLFASLFIALMLALISGGVSSAALSLIPAIGGLSITLGTMVLLDIPLNMGNCICIPFLLGMGVDGGVHLVHRFRSRGRAELGSCGTAIWRTSATSMLAFGALAVAQTPVVASIGQLGVIGVLASFACCIFLLPASWKLLPERYRPCS